MIGIDCSFQQIVRLTAIVLFTLFGSSLSGAWFLPLPNLPGARQPNDAMAVSADGTTIVGTANDGVTPDGQSNRAVRWDTTGAIQVVDASDGSFAWGVSGDGSVMVGYRLVFEPRGFQDGFRCTATTGPILIGDLPGGNVLSRAYDVSEDGQIVVGVSGVPGTVEAFRWTVSTGMEGIGDLPGGVFSSVAYEASRDGSVIVGYSHSSNGSEAFRWSKQTGMVGLGDLPGDGFFSEAYDVSADGSVVVGRSIGRNPFDYTAFRWTAETGMIGIPPTPAGAWAVTVEAISADGNVIVGGTNRVIGAFAWDPYHGTRAVADLLREQGVDITGWELGIARGISADGLTIVGQGVPPGTRRQQAWALRLDPGTFIPEPSSLLLSIIGSGALLFLVRRRLWTLRFTGSLSNATRKSACQLLTLSACALASHSAFGAWFMPLGYIPGGDRHYSDALDISADGSTVVGVTTNDGANYFAIRWTLGSGMQIIGSGEIHLATAVSNDGSVIVGSRYFENGNAAIRWTESGGAMDLGRLPGSQYSGPLDVSADGSIVIGGASSALSGEAFRWSAATGMVGLGQLPSAPYRSVARAVSADGSVIVGNAHPSPFSVQTVAFKWTAATGMTPLHELPGSIIRSSVNDVSADGSVVVGGSATADDPDRWRGFRWTQDNGMVELPAMPNGRRIQSAEGISGDGNVIVGLVDGSSGTAFAWDTLHGSRSISALLAAQGVDLGNWNLQTAHAASYDGLTIIGQGINPDGVTEGWIARLDPGTFIPEPSSVALSGVCLAALILYACCKRAR